ncbi:hypothetical protein RJT12_04790 [Segatella copri]|uniref:hypothetical protein n=1 Tax=Segatella copri TaxID=165179 RepID=UPI0025FCCD3A|nr:hypothetical protein [Segatella copri]WOF98071.1 hypothetical protein RJT12_04790 [Segatella copri]
MKTWIIRIMKNLIVFMLLFCMLSCTKERRERHMVSFIVKDLERYPMGKNSYLIVNSKDVPIWYNRIKGSYWVGPFYEDLIQSPFGFSFSSGNVYKIAASENVYMFDKHMKSKDTISICYAVRDSVPIVNSENASDTMFINKTPFINYTKRARMYKRHRDSVWVNYQPDTLVMPKIKRDTLIEK